MMMKQLGFRGRGGLYGALLFAPLLIGIVFALPPRAIAQCSIAPVAGCVPAPISGSGGMLSCRGPHLIRGATFQRILLKWGSGPLMKADFGNPLTTDSYQLCIYDGASSLIAAVTAPAGRVCNVDGRPSCWKEKSNGFIFLGTPPTLNPPYGVWKMFLKAGPNGQIRFDARGAQIPMLTSPPFAQPVTVQVQNTGSGRCWEATYSAPAIRNGMSGPYEAFADRPD